MKNNCDRNQINAFVIIQVIATFDNFIPFKMVQQIYFFLHWRLAIKLCLACLSCCNIHPVGGILDVNLIFLSISSPEPKTVLVLMYVLFLYVYAIICSFVNMYGFSLNLAEPNLPNLGTEGEILPNCHNKKLNPVQKGML